MDKKNFFNKFISFITSVHRVTHESKKKARSNTITPIQYNILEYIAVSQPVTLSQVSDCTHMSMPNTSRELKKLSERNLVEKMGNTEDRRKQFIHLSKDGELMMKVAFSSMETHFLQRLKDASTEDLEEIDQALDVLQKKLFY